MDEIRSLKAKPEGLEKEILSLNDYESRKERASHIERDLFNLRVAVSQQMEESLKKEHKDDKFGVLAMAGVNLPRIEIPNFDGNILNWCLFWKQFQAAVHDKPPLEEVDKLTYLQGALKDGPARNVIKGLTQTAESYQEAVRGLKDLCDHPRLTHCEHVHNILNAPALKAHNGRELRKLYDTCTSNQHIRAINAFDAYDIDTFLMIVMELKLDEVTKLR